MKSNYHQWCTSTGSRYNKCSYIYFRHWHLNKYRYWFSGTVLSTGTYPKQCWHRWIKNNSLLHLTRKKRLFFIRNKYFTNYYIKTQYHIFYNHLCILYNFKNTLKCYSYIIKLCKFYYPQWCAVPGNFTGNGTEVGTGLPVPVPAKKIMNFS